MLLTLRDQTQSILTLTMSCYTPPRQLQVAKSMWSSNPEYLFVTSQLRLSDMSLPDIPDLGYKCRYCQSTDVVPVLDRGIEQAPKAGNKYRRHCLNCWRWLPMCSASYFRMHDDPHVLPVGAEPERENLAPLEVYREDNEDKSNHPICAGLAAAASSI